MTDQAFANSQSLGSAQAHVDGGLENQAKEPLAQERAQRVEKNGMETARPPRLCRVLRYTQPETWAMRYP